MNMSRNCYLAGPMSGIPNFNFPAFNAAAERLRSQGHSVFNPAERDVIRHGGVDISFSNDTGSQEQAVKDFGFSLEDALLEDLTFIIKGDSNGPCTTIAFLPGFEQSGGAMLEFMTAKHFKREFLYL